MSDFSNYFKENYAKFTDCKNIDDVKKILKEEQFLNFCSGCRNYKIIDEFSTKKEGQKHYKVCKICKVYQSNRKCKSV